MENITIKEGLSVSPNGFVFDVSTGETFSCNETGKDIINLLSQKKTTEEIINYILNSYQTDIFTIERDFYDFISLLKQRNLIQIVE